MCEVREAYTGPEGLIEHNTNIVEARNKLFKDYADDHFMTVYGEPSQPLITWPCWIWSLWIYQNHIR